MSSIKLEPFTTADFNDLINWIDDPDLMTEWAGGLFRFPLTEKSLQWYIEDTNRRGKSSAFVFKVVDIDSGKSIGHASIGSISYGNESGRLTRIFIAKEHQGKGYCKQIMHALLKFGFEELKLHRMELGVYTHKTAAIRCYQRSGFKTDGVMRDILKTADGFWSIMEMSVLSHEWPQISMQ